jgi:hypothetical protein
LTVGGATYAADEQAKTKVVEFVGAGTADDSRRPNRREAERSFVDELSN